MKHIDKLIEELDSGVTRPYRGIMESNRGIIKISENNFGVKVLINEILCYYLASELNLKIPKGELCVIDASTKIDEELEYMIGNEMIDVEGICFFSTELTMCNIFSPTFDIDILENKKDINKIVLFDYIIYNKDRHMQNVLLSLSDGCMYIIDHSHAFNCDSSLMWDAKILKERIDSGDYKDYNIFKKNIEHVYGAFLKNNLLNIADLESFAIQIRNTITEEYLKTIIKKLPNLWREKYSEDIDILIKYILYRINHINVAIDIMKNVITLEGGLL